MKNTKSIVNYICLLLFVIFFFFGTNNLYNASKGVTLHYKVSDQREKVKHYYILEKQIQVDQYICFSIDYDLQFRFHSQERVISYGYQNPTISIGDWSTISVSLEYSDDTSQTVNENVEIKVMISTMSPPQWFYVYFILAIISLLVYFEFDSLNELPSKDEEEEQFWEEIKKEEETQNELNSSKE